MTKNDLQSYQVLKREALYLDRQIAKASCDDRTRQTWEASKARASDALESIETALSTLKPEERLILRLRYIEGMSWTQVCLRAHYSRTQVFRLHAAALKRIG